MRPVPSPPASSMPPTKARSSSACATRACCRCRWPRATGMAAGTAGARAETSPRRSWFASKTRHGDQLLAITRELATLLQAGLPLDRALEIQIGLAVAAPAAALLQQIRDDVRGGKSLSQALDTRRDVFSRFYVNIVRAGEAGGALGVVLTRLADTMERNKDLRESVKSALIYPVHPDRRRRAVRDGAPGVGGAAVRADLRPGRQGAATAHAGRHRPRHRAAPLVVGGGGSSSRAIVWWVRRKLASAGGAPCAWMPGCSACPSSAIS